MVQFHQYLLLKLHVVHVVLLSKQIFVEHLHGVVGFFLALFDKENLCEATLTE